MVTLINDEDLNEIVEISREYVDSKLDLEKHKAELWLNTDWINVLGKAKPTIKDKEEWIKLETISEERNVRHLEIDLNNAKRVYNVKMRMMEQGGSE